MAKIIITGNEPYYPIIGDTNWNVTPGITIRQKFIGDFIIQNFHVYGDNEIGKIACERESKEAFESYLKIINQEDI